MSGWLARGSQRGEALMSRFRGASPLKDKEVDAGACFESFRIHWQQAWDMMQAHLVRRTLESGRNVRAQNVTLPLVKAETDLLTR